VKINKRATWTSSDLATRNSVGNGRATVRAGSRPTEGGKSPSACKTHSESSAAQDYRSPADGAPCHVSRLVTAICATRPTTAIGRQRPTGQRPSPSPPALRPAAIQLATPPPSG
jgi:hypothetical protein